LGASQEVTKGVKKTGSELMLFKLMMSLCVFGFYNKGIENISGCFFWHKKTAATHRVTAVFKQSLTN